MASEVVDRLAASGVRLVQLALVDATGITRMKVVPLERLESAASSGIGWALIWAVVGTDDHFAEDPLLFTPAGDIRLVADLGSAVPLWRPGYAWAAVDQCDLEGVPLTTCPRAAVRRQIARAAGDGFEVSCAFECEMTVLGADGTPAHGGPAHSSRALEPLEEFALRLTEAMSAEGVPVEQLHAEYSPGQFEISTGPADPLTAADRLVLLRQTARHVARALELQVSFAPVVIPGAVGNGCHLHVSLWQDGENQMTGGDGPGGLRPIGAHAIAGLLEHLPSFVAPLAPTVPSYDRLRPGMWAGGTACWGTENREAALRLIPGSRASRARSANVELKVPDGAVNPYTAVACTLVAALDGVARRLALPAPVDGDPALADAAASAIRPLPESLAAAADAFRAWSLGAALGNDLHRLTAAVLRREADVYADASPDELAAALRFRF